MTEEVNPPIDSPIKSRRAEDLSADLEEALDIVGSAWFAQRMARELASRQATETAARRGFVAGLKDAHPLIQWRIEFDALCTARTTHPDTPIGENVVLLGEFVRCLLKAKGALKGLDYITPRLRIDEEFLAAAFEIEIACVYLDQGWSVEAVEPGPLKGPDLKVTTDKGIVLWAECKRRDPMTGRDRRISRLWRLLTERLQREWEPTKTNVAVVLRSLSDPTRAEVDLLSPMLLEGARQLVRHPQRQTMVAACRTDDGKYEAELRFLGEPDDVRRSITAPLLDFDMSEMSARRAIAADGGPGLTNPKIFAFKNADAPDKFRGLLTTFQNAADQLPPEGPGVIHIRLQLSRQAKAQQEFDEVAKKIRAELDGKNRRVNAVVLSAVLLEPDQAVTPRRILYRRVSYVIENTNPRAPFQG